MEHSAGQTLLEVVNLDTHFGQHHVVRGFNLCIAKGETIAIIGETGSGKTVALSSILGLLNASKAKVSMDKIIFIDKLPIEDKRGKEVTMVFQNARQALNPIKTCGKQIQRILCKHLQIDKGNAKEKALEILRSVEIKEAERIYKSYPHEVSGGELQRVMIAMAISCSPKLLILDEPVASLDKITQYKIIQLLQKIRKEQDLAIILISHDLEMVSGLADHIIHIDKGAIIAAQSAKDFFTDPAHELSRTLVLKLKQFRDGQFVSNAIASPILHIRSLSKKFKNGLFAFRDINLELNAGEILGLIGESGSGKSSLGKCIAGIWDYDLGNIDTTVAQDKICYVFQDAYSAMDPELTVYAILYEVLRLKSSKEKPIALLKAVFLSEDILEKKIVELSGGQRQRVNLARALATDPEILICDEITSGLDLIVQIEIVELIANMKQNMSIIFISHDITLMKFLCHRLIILKNGQIEKMGDTKEIFEQSASGYTFDLINSVPKVKYFLNT